MNSPKVRELLARVFAISYQDDTETTTQADVEPDQDGVVVVVPELSELLAEYDLVVDYDLSSEFEPLPPLPPPPPPGCDDVPDGMSEHCDVLDGMDEDVERDVPELSEVDRKALVKQRWLNAINKVRDEISQVGAFSILRPTTSIPSHDRSGRTARCVAKGIRGVSCFVWLSAL